MNQRNNNFVRLAAEMPKNVTAASVSIRGREISRDDQCLVQH